MNVLRAFRVQWTVGPLWGEVMDRQLSDGAGER